MADIIELMVGYLDTQTASDVTVATRVPDPRPLKLVQLRLISWPKLPPVRRVARFDVFTWGADVTDDPGAIALGITVRTLINALARNSTALNMQVYRVDETLGLHPDDDPETGVPRGWATYAITHRDDEVVY